MSPLRVATDQSELDVALIHRYPAQHTHWARDIPLAVAQRSIANSLCFGGFLGGGQVAFAQVVSDYATVAYLYARWPLPQQPAVPVGARGVTRVAALWAGAQLPAQQAPVHAAVRRRSRY